jgi:hypothetical protein
MMIIYIKLQRKMLLNLFSTRFHTEQPEKHALNKLAGKIYSLFIVHYLPYAVFSQFPIEHIVPTSRKTLKILCFQDLLRN